MYLESKAIELISHQLAQLAFTECRSKRSFPLCPDDIERIHDAKGILVRNMENPPSLLDLARQIGLNDTKLKRGFRYIFGTTVFGYLQLKRLERARSLLEERNMNISEVAVTVGYSSLSHFAKVFKQHFGTKPSSYLSELLNKAD
jgi:AraC-like DNA-binding protein